MTGRLRRIGAWTLRGLLVVLILLTLYVLVVYYPNPLFSYRAEFGNYRVYSDQPIPADLARVIEDAKAREAAMEGYRPGRTRRVFLCQSPRRYALMARLVRKSPQALAMGLSLPKNIFLSATRIRQFAARNRGVFEHSRFEGNMAEVIAHEVAHFHSVRGLGFWDHIVQPLWKSEGWAEYQANAVHTRREGLHGLARRVDLLLNDAHWDPNHPLARRMYEWDLLVEYLGEVEGLGLADLADEGTTESRARDAMMGWYRSREPDPRGAPDGSSS
jgi:hypothetical protein